MIMMQLRELMALAVTADHSTEFSLNDMKDNSLMIRMLDMMIKEQ